MCGIAGYLLRSPTRAPVGVLEGLLDGIRQRGPDDEGICLIQRQGGVRRHFRTDRSVGGTEAPLTHYSAGAGSFRHDLALINTRFAIQDASPAGHQPFASADGSVIGVFNGEIYNFLELRAELEAYGVVFRTRCDTEVLIEGFRRWKHEVWPRLNGFWATAILDVPSGSVTLSRDRMGVAPLYLRETPAGVFFASSIAPLRRVHPPTGDVDAAGVAGFIETSLKDFGESTLFSEVRHAPASACLDFSVGTAGLAEAKPRQYWQLPMERLQVGDLSIDEAARRVRETLVDAVELRLRADVPVAFELSGGLDSSSIVAAASELRGGGITTYTIEVPEQNEEPYARSILSRHAVDYRVLRDPEANFLPNAESFGRIMEEPYHSPNIYTHFEMRKRMKAEGVSVVVSGSGGDEVLAGYEYLFWDRASKAIRTDGGWGEACRYEIARMRRDLRSLEGARAVARRSAKRLARTLGIRRGGNRVEGVGDNPAIRLQRSYPRLSYPEQRAYHFEVGLLPYYLRSNDHFTMEIPIEHRFPFLDFRLVELGLRLPPSYLFHEGWTKYVLRKAMEPLLPEKIVWRREKMGFPFPHRRFLSDHRHALAPYFNRSRERRLLRPDDSSYDAVLRSDPIRLWRACSTGLWLAGL